MADFSDLFPLFARSEEDIRADFDTRANAGLTPDDPDWVDIRQGSPFHFTTQVMVPEFASVYDRMNEILAASIMATSWGDALDAHAASYGEVRLAAVQATGEVTFSGANGTLIASGTRVGLVQTDPDVDPPIFEVTTSGSIGGGGTVTLPVRALEAGPEGNVDTGTITELITGVTGVTGNTNANPTTNGADVEDDDALKTRLLLRLQGGGMNVARYAAKALSWPGVGGVSVEPHWNGPGTVRLSLLDAEGNPVAAPVVNAFQAHMDPIDQQGLGKGWAPINHVVTIITPTAILINTRIVFTVEPGVIAANLHAEIQAALEAWYDSLEPGEDVVWNAALAQVFRVEGVEDVTTFRTGTGGGVPAGTTLIAIAANEVARPGNFTFV